MLMWFTVGVLPSSRMGITRKTNHHVIRDQRFSTTWLLTCEERGRQNTEFNHMANDLINYASVIIPGLKTLDTRLQSSIEISGWWMYWHAEIIHWSSTRGRFEFCALTPTSALPPLPFSCSWVVSFNKIIHAVPSVSSVSCSSELPRLRELQKASNV